MMKENVLDILMYLFENYMYGDMEDAPDQEALRVRLLQVGFPDNEIQKAFSWIESIPQPQEQQSRAELVSTGAVRVFSPDETNKLEAQCRGFLIYLEGIGVLDGASRELVIDRIMALDNSRVDIAQLKWIILMVLYNQPGQEEALAWMEDLIFEGSDRPLH